MAVAIESACGMSTERMPHPPRMIPPISSASLSICRASRSDHRARSDLAALVASRWATSAVSKNRREALARCARPGPARIDVGADEEQMREGGEPRDEE